MPPSSSTSTFIGLSLQSGVKMPGNSSLRPKLLCLGLIMLQLVVIVAVDSTSNDQLATTTTRCGPDAEKAASRCLEPMLAYANAVQLADGSSGQQQHRHFSFQGPQVFRRLCRLYDEFKECTATLQCQSLSEQAVDASYGFMCGTGQAQFQQHADCFAQVENRPDYIRCREQASEAMDRVAASQQQAEAVRQREEEGSLADHTVEHQQALCTAMADYLGCCRPLVERNCGPVAWALVARITRDSLRVSLPQCRLAALAEGKVDAAVDDANESRSH